MRGLLRPDSIEHRGTCPGATDQKAEEVSAMAQLPGRWSVRTITLVDPSRELEDIDDHVEITG
jgi:hypothetical protein